MPTTSQSSSSDPVAGIRALAPIECGSETAKHFLFDKGYVSLNHGSYGTYPIWVRTTFRHYQDLTEQRPDDFVRYQYRTKLLDKSRALVAEYLHCPLNSLVLVPNSTTAFECIIRNLEYERGDVVITFSSIYGSFNAPLQYLSETTPLEVSQIEYKLPIEDDELIRLFQDRIMKVKGQGKRPLLAVFDTINTLPAVKMPFERLVQVCKEHGVLSCVDGAHGVGLFPIDVEALDADFLMSNCHKWLYVPRPCAVLCVPERNQKFLRTSLPIGFDWVSKGQADQGGGDGKSAFVKTFAYTGTLDDNPYLCLEAALEWRKKLTWGTKVGEEAIMGYIHDLADKGGRLVAQILGTEVLENKTGTLGGVGFANVRLSLASLAEDKSGYIEQVLEKARIGDTNDAVEVAGKIMRCLIQQYDTAMFVHFYEGSWWVRMSAQVYLTFEDFERAGKLLKKVCDSREWL